jgi:hypothetical protein
MTRQRSDPCPTVTIATRAPNIIEGHADRRVGVAALHGQVEVDDGVAGIARDNEPVMFRRERSGYCRPEPRAQVRAARRRYPRLY